MLAPLYYKAYILQLHNFYMINYIMPKHMEPARYLLHLGNIPTVKRELREIFYLQFKNTDHLD